MADLQRPTARQVAEECARRIDALVAWLGLAPLVRVNHVWTPLNPTRGDRTPGSFVIYAAGHPKQGGWCDFATGDKGDALDLCGYVRAGAGFTRAEAFKVAQRFLGWDSADALTLPAQAPARAALEADRAAAADREAAALAKDRSSALAWWLKDAQLAVGDPVWRYLTETRAIALERLPAPPGAIRVASAHRNTETGRAMLAMRCLISAPEGQPKGAAPCWGVHTTFLAETGGVIDKAALHAPRKIWPRGFWGGAIRLTKGASGLAPAAAARAGATDVLALGEGVETCLTVAAAAPEWRVWAAGAKGAIGRTIWPPCTRAVVLLAENDAGDRAADLWLGVLRDVAAQAKARGLPVYEARPRAGVNDWNDAVRRLRAGALGTGV